MSTEHFVYRSTIPASAEAVFDWHRRPGAFDRLTPPWEDVEVLDRQGGIEDGGRVVLGVRTGGVQRRWVAEHYGYVPGREFNDVQVEGPFASWRHSHRVSPEGPENCVLEDQIDYALPFGLAGRALGAALVRRKLERMFRYRHHVSAADLNLHQRYSGVQAMKIAITGSTGLVGSALVPFLTTGGHRALRISRSARRTETEAIVWDPSIGQLDVTRLEGLDAVVHLAGENIAARRWSTKQKARILDSRVQGTRLLCKSLARLKRPPRVLVSASAIGYYGDRGDELLDEKSSRGNAFLSDVCQAWEESTQPAAEAGIRVVNLRFGVILSPKGGALAKMLTPFRLGLGGRIGTGRQWMSWISLDDAIGCIYHAMATPGLHGPVNAVSPNPVTNKEFTATLASVLSRPAFLPMPSFAARLAFGQLADELLIASTRVAPKALLESGCPFFYPHLEMALRHMLGRYDTVPELVESRTLSTHHNQPVVSRN
jgi:uncharacterized protein (TIGR01777 family)